MQFFKFITQFSTYVSTSFKREGFVNRMHFLLKHLRNVNLKATTNNRIHQTINNTKASELPIRLLFFFYRFFNMEHKK